MTSEPEPTAPGIRPETVTLTNCDREPIRIPGATQPHGVLLGVDPDGLRVVLASANTARMLGAAPDDVVGRPLGHVLPQASVVELEPVLNGAPPANVSPFQAVVDGPDAPAVVDVTVSWSEGLLLLELEPARHGFLLERVRAPRPVHRALDALDRAPTLEAMCDALAGEVRELTGYDRVMVYRFDADWNGEVVAERRHDRAEPFLGLRYPHTDIPAQARALYAENRLRIIVDVGYEPVPLVPQENPLTGRPVDLGHAVLRSVSPIHVRYLQNMGVGGTLTISLMDRGRLWGLVACHHDRPHEVPASVRSACELIGQVASMQVGLKKDESEAAYEAGRRGVLARLVEALRQEEDVPAALVHGGPTVLDLVDAAGAAVVHGGAVTTVGEAPSPTLVRALLDAISREAGGTDVVAFDDLASFPDEAPRPEGVAGVLAAATSTDWSSGVLWFRPEVAKTVTWAGQPHKDAVLEEDGTLTLRPRASFASWSELVRGHAEPWTRGDLRAAGDLARAVVSVVTSLADALARMNAELEKSNRELDAFAYIASHDLKEPLRGIHNYAQFVIEDHAEALGEDGRARLETISKLSRRLDGLIDSLLRYSRVGRVELAFQAVDLGQAALDARDLLGSRFEASGGRLVGAETLPTVQADPVMVGEIFANLFSNALKYTDSDAPTITVGVLDGEELEARAHRADGRPVVYVRDDGIGIAERHLDSVFQIFRRLHAREAYGGGTGAGLTIVRKLVERHNGTVWAESERGVGTTFFFTLGGDAARARGG